MLRLLLVFILLSGPAWPARALELVMVEQAGCAWCARWDREVAPEYHLTEEGRAAPLRRIDLHQPVPDDLALETRPRLTPTFVLVDDEGRELGRIEGYPGEDFFWGLLGVLLERAGWSQTEQD